MLFACYFSQINQNKNIRVGIHEQERIYFLYSIYQANLKGKNCWFERNGSWIPGLELKIKLDLLRPVRRRCGYLFYYYIM